MDTVYELMGINNVGCYSRGPLFYGCQLHSIYLFFVLITFKINDLDGAKSIQRPSNLHFLVFLSWRLEQVPQNKRKDACVSTLAHTVRLVPEDALHLQQACKEIFLRLLCERGL